jgi:hypothetical protein
MKDALQKTDISLQKTDILLLKTDKKNTGFQLYQSQNPA